MFSMKIIKGIYDNDYGCEEHADSEKLKYYVLITDGQGNEEYLLVEDDYLKENNLDVGSIWISQKEDLQ